MTTYQDIADYMNKNYPGKFTLVIHDDYYTINNNNDYYYTICINKDSYSTIGSFNIGKGLNKLLTDILNTPVNQRINSEIEHTVKPATKESLLTRLTSADQVIQAINTFLVSARSNPNPNPIMTIATDIGVDNLNKVLKLYDDYNIMVINKNVNSDIFNLLIEPK